jgi:hypothetical protein
MCARSSAWWFASRRARQLPARRATGPRRPAPRDKGVSQRVRANALGDARLARRPVDDPSGAVLVQPADVCVGSARSQDQGSRAGSVIHTLPAGYVYRSAQVEVQFVAQRSPCYGRSESRAIRRSDDLSRRSPEVCDDASGDPRSLTAAAVHVSGSGEIKVSTALTRPSRIVRTSSPRATGLPGGPKRHAIAAVSATSYRGPSSSKT